MFRISMHDAHHLLTPFHIKKQMLRAFTKYNHEQGLLTAFFMASHHNQIHSFSGKGQCKASLDFKIKMSNATYHWMLLAGVLIYHIYIYIYIYIIYIYIYIAWLHIYMIENVIIKRKLSHMWNMNCRVKEPRARKKINAMTCISMC
jgi:hypothetical protein